jgi:hypothetical protein
VFRTVADFISPVTMALYWRGLRPRLWVLCVECFASRTTDEIAQAYVVGICFMGIYAFVCFVFVRGALRASEIIISQSVSPRGPRRNDGPQQTQPTMEAKHTPIPLEELF